MGMTPILPALTNAGVAPAFGTPITFASPEAPVTYYYEGGMVEQLPTLPPTLRANKLFAGGAGDTSGTVTAHVEPAALVEFKQRIAEIDQEVDGLRLAAYEKLKGKPLTQELFDTIIKPLDDKLTAAVSEIGRRNRELDVITITERWPTRDNVERKRFHHNYSAHYLGLQGILGNWLYFVVQRQTSLSYDPLVLVPPSRLGGIVREAQKFNLQTLAYSSGIEIKLFIDDGLATLELDKEVQGQIKDIMMNLVNNAVKYFNPQVPAGKRVVEITVERIGDKLYVSVRDNGRGMSEEVLAKYGSGERDPKVVSEGIEGTGLGSGSVIDSVDKLGGAFNIKSIEGEWTEAELVIPLKRLSREMEAKPSDKTPEDYLLSGTIKRLLALGIPGEEIKKHMRALYDFGRHVNGDLSKELAAPSLSIGSINQSLSCYNKVWLVKAPDGSLHLTDKKPFDPEILALIPDGITDAGAIAMTDRMEDEFEEMLRASADTLNAMNGKIVTLEEYDQVTRQIVERAAQIFKLTAALQWLFHTPAQNSMVDIAMHDARPFFGSLIEVNKKNRLEKIPEGKPVRMDEFLFSLDIGSILGKFNLHKERTREQNGVDLLVTMNIPRDIAGRALPKRNARILRKILDNLVSNSAKYANLSLNESERRARLRSRLIDGMLIFRMKDNGRGMIPERLATVRSLGIIENVGPDEQALAEGMETHGIGLGNVYRMVQKFGGTLEIESKVGVGTEVIVKIPLDALLN